MALLTFAVPHLRGRAVSKATHAMAVVLFQANALRDVRPHPEAVESDRRVIPLQSDSVQACNDL